MPKPTKKDLVALLRRLEWLTPHRVCPLCSRREQEGHDPSCELAKALEA